MSLLWLALLLMAAGAGMIERGTFAVDRYFGMEVSRLRRGAGWLLILCGVITGVLGFALLQTWAGVHR